MSDNPQASGAKRSMSFRRMPVLLTILFSFITFGIYGPVWFMTRRRAINALRSKEKLELTPLIIVLVGYSVSLILIILGKALISLLDLRVLGLGFLSLLIGRFVLLFAAIVNLVQCFRVRRIIESHLGLSRDAGNALSGAAVFFFQVWYFQHIVNARLLIQSDDRA